MNDLKKLQKLSKNLNVLYVEDNNALRENVQRLLRKFFSKVSVAKDGEEGLEKFKKYQQAIVITDIKMPKMDGLTLAKEIQKISPKTKVIVMSAFDDQESLLKMIEHGVFKFLKKPVKLDTLSDMLYASVLSLQEESQSINTIKAEDAEAVKKEEKDETLENTALLFEILRTLQNKQEKIEVHNYYKGLSITNDAVILEVTKNTLLIQTTLMQQKAMQYEERTILVSDSFPYAVVCKKVQHTSFKMHTIELSHLSFAKTSQIQRKTVRVRPKDDYTVSLYLNEKQVNQDVQIEDISIHSLRLKLNSLPAGLRVCENISIHLNLEKGACILQSKLEIFRIDETPTDFQIVFLFEKTQKSNLMKYVTKRQMEMIREFKGRQNG